MKTAAMISATKHLRKSNVDAGKCLNLLKQNIACFKNRFCCQLVFVRGEVLATAIFENVSREQAWETLQKMSSNPECIESIMRSLHKYCAQQLDHANPFYGAERDIMDSHLGGLLHQILLTSIVSFSLTRQRSRSGTDFQMSAPVQQKWNRQRLVGVLVSVVNFCYLCLQKSGSCRQFAALSTLNKVIDAGLVNSVFGWPQIVFHSSRLLNRSHEFQSQDDFEAGLSFVEDPLQAKNEKSDRRETGDSSSAPALILQSFYRKHGVNVGSQHNKVRLSDLQKAFSSMQPSIIIAYLHNSITMHNREAGNRSVCSPAHRWRQCYNILLFLASFKEFRQKISERSQLRTLIQLLEPTLDPQLLCLLLQTIALIALNPSTHRHFIEMQVDNPLIQMLLPADDWYYTNHSTKFGHFVKHHAARILIYIGLGERVGNRVSLFDDSLLATSVTRRSLTSSQGHAANNSTSANEDDYICETLRPATMAQEFSRTAMSVEGILLKIMQELSRNQASNGTGSGAQEPISEETPSACASVIASPTVQVRSIVVGQNSANCIIEECEEKPDSPLPPLIMPSPAFIDDTPTSTPPTSVEANLCTARNTATSNPFISLTSQPRPTSVAVPEKQIQSQAVKRAPSSPPASVSATVARVYNTLVFLDPMLLLRLLLHKLSWDLSLVAKKRPTIYGHGSANATPTATPIITSVADSRRAHSSCSLGSSFKRGCEEQNSKNSIKDSKRFLRVDYAGGSSRLSKRVHIRRSSSVEIPRPKRFSSGAKELRKERNRKRLGTDTSSGSGKSKKTNSSSTSSVQKHLPKYLTNLFRGRMGTDPCKRHHSRASRESSPDSPLSGSEAVLEFTKKLQNIPPTRRDTLRMAYKQAGQQDSAGTAGSAGERIQRHIGYGHLPELEVNSASPPRSPLISTAIVAAAALTSENNSASSSVAVASGNVVDLRRPSSPPVLPGLPLIEIRRPSALSQFEFGYFVNSPEVMSNSQGGSATGSVSDDCAPLLLSGGPIQCVAGVPAQALAFPNDPHLAAFDSPPSQEALQLLRTIQAHSYSALSFERGHRPLEHASLYRREQSPVQAEIAVLNTPQHPGVKSWCADILNVINSQLETEEESKLESEERINDDYLDVGFLVLREWRGVVRSYFKGVIREWVPSSKWPIEAELVAILGIEIEKFVTDRGA
uniref:Uncharacterized protein n=1 Tax=Meloidogyne javanica TaxID=6303 RepID=A0A915N3L3_MELJA